MKPTKVNIVSHTGHQLLIERDTERNAINERAIVATWPDDARSQRMWGLSVISQGRLFDAGDVDEMCANADRIVAWVNGE